MQYILNFTGPEFNSKGGVENRITMDQYYFIINASEILRHIGTIQANPRHCSFICSLNPQCHGFISSLTDLCDLYDYFPMPSEGVAIEEYYQIF